MNKKLAIQFQKMLHLKSFLFKDSNKFVGARWLTQQDSNVCPVCRFLGEQNWLPFDAFPDISQAHSQLGGPNWKSSDEDCRCTTDFMRRKFTAEELLIGPKEIEDKWFAYYATLSKQEKEIKLCSCKK